MVFPFLCRVHSFKFTFHIFLGQDQVTILIDIPCTQREGQPWRRLGRRFAHRLSRQRLLCSRVSDVVTTMEDVVRRDEEGSHVIVEYLPR